jgi:hypothetical protein
MLRSFVEGLGFFCSDLKIAEGFGPHLVEVGAEARDTLGVELIKAACSAAGVEYQACVFEHFEVLRDGGAADRERVGEFVDGERARRKLLKDSHARGVAEGVETGLEAGVHERGLVSQSER